MKATSDAPIGMFDSGLGGLTVVKQIIDKLPAESVIYMADEIHVPFGERPLEEIRGIALGITRYMIDRGAKMVVMACNMSSATALDAAGEMFPEVPVIGVIEPGARAAMRVTKNGRVGVLATTGTVRSGAYEREILRISPQAQAFQQACPKFVPIVESGHSESDEANKAAEEYVRPLAAAGCDTIILGCTHYPFLSAAIRKAAGDIVLVDPAEETLAEAQRILGERGLLSSRKDEPEHIYCTSAFPEKFARLGSMFLEREIGSVSTLTWGTDLSEVKCREKTSEKTISSVL